MWFQAHPSFIAKHNGLAGYSGAEELARDVALRRHAPWYVTSSEHLVVPRARDDDPDSSASIVPIADRRQLACEILRGLFGDATILIVTRGFRDALVSDYAHYVRRGGQMSLPGRYAGSGTATDAGVGVDDYLDYDAAIADFEHAFGPERVIVLPYELLRDDPREFVATLEDRLGIPRSTEFLPWVNTKLTDAELRWYPRFSRVVSRVCRLLGGRGGRVEASYRRQIGGPRLRRYISSLSRLIPEHPPDLSAQVPEALLARCQSRATKLVVRAEYARYRERYGGAGPHARA